MAMNNLAEIFEAELEGLAVNFAESWTLRIPSLSQKNPD